MFTSMGVRRSCDLALRFSKDGWIAKAVLMSCALWICAQRLFGLLLLAARHYGTHSHMLACTVAYCQDSVDFHMSRSDCNFIRYNAASGADDDLDGNEAADECNAYL